MLIVVILFCRKSFYIHHEQGDNKSIILFSKLSLKSCMFALLNLFTCARILLVLLDLIDCLTIFMS